MPFSPASTVNGAWIQGIEFEAQASLNVAYDRLALLPRKSVNGSYSSDLGVYGISSSCPELTIGMGAR